MGGTSVSTPGSGTPVESGDGDTEPRMLLVAGENAFSAHPLTGRELTIGRARGCDVRVDHLALSRKHAVLRLGPPPTIQDLGSTNGTRVAGETVSGGEPRVLRANDSFHIGPFSFVLVSKRPVSDRSYSGKRAMRVVDPTPAGVPALVRDVATRETNVLILGETGCGKEVLAETVHELSRRSGPLMRINCAALSESLLESELFGHEKGAFTGAAAQKRGLLEAATQGTVFLDEVGELPLSTQAKLLRAVEHREVLRLGATKPIPIDVRFVAATNRELPAEVAAGRFRRDLFFRLDGVTLVVPPLRERTHMIGALALDFLDAACKRIGRATRLSTAALGELEQHSWPGNVRELRAVIERAVLLARSGDIQVQHLTFARAEEPTPPSSRPAPAARETTPVSPEEAAVIGLDAEQRDERARIIAALEACAGNQTRAAARLGMPRTTLSGKLAVYRIPRPRT
jgi:two-component system, NtrC family, response regulator AtoC